MRVYVEQHGCSVTQAEASTVKGILASGGHGLARSPDEADAHVLVTCTVVEATEREMRKRIAALSATGKRLVVTGCMAKAQPEAIGKIDPRAVVLPPAHLHQVADGLAAAPVVLRSGPRTGLPRHREGAVETIVVSEGCVGRCSFCITKLARPGLSSFSPEEVARDVASAVAAGTIEIRLTSQDTATYGRERGLALSDAIAALREVPGDFRVRVGMMNPMAAKPVLLRILEAFRDPRVFKFLHLPVQSGSDRVLAAMRRDHTANDFLDIVAAFRAEFPDLSLATDVIVGFPGESEDDFEETLRVVREARPDIVNVTRFSPRPGTRAFGMPGRPHGRIVKERSRKLHALRFELSRANYESLVGREFSVLVAERSRPGTVMARTDEYKLVVLPDVPLGRRLPVRIVGARDVYALGEVVASTTNARLLD